jgi:ribosomal-protein-alanine N-acetyltransferase
VTPEDSAALARRYTQDRDFLRSWDPARTDEFFTETGQRALIERLSSAPVWAGVILLDGDVVGRIDLHNIQRGPLQCCSLGYWVAREVSGRGIATRAVADALRVAFGRLGLHRVDAYARADNPGSCKVLERNDFERAGISREHVFIDGRWRDDLHFQRITPG